MKEKSSTFIVPKLTYKKPMKQSAIEVFINFFSKNYEIIIGSLFGIGAKVAMDSKSRKLSVGEIIGKFLIGGACGWIWFNYCMSHQMVDTAKWSVPVMTMLGESIILLLMKNISPILRAIVMKNTGIEKEDWKDDTKS